MFEDLVPLVAVVLIFGPVLFNSWARHRREMAQIQAANVKANETDRAEIERLRRELAELRQTSTEFDLSLQDNMEQLRQRLEHLEGQRASVENRLP
ncbi:MAG: hypothetical protein HUU60_09050 [Armatimonadetes bacterium]|nr:hypothetical protein [Armatimonadota bacterium]